MKRRTVVAVAIAAAVTVTGCDHPHHDHPTLACVRGNESANEPDPYTAQNPVTSASGAYQMVTRTWQTISREMGVGTEYAKAKHAPPIVQDAVAYYAMVDPGHYNTHWTGANRQCFR